MDNQNIKIAVIGLGYVGLPLARLLATQYSVVGYDHNKTRISSIKYGKDETLEVSEKQLREVLCSKTPKATEKGLYCTADFTKIKDANVYIITVPTPVDHHKKPDLSLLLEASKTVGSILKTGDLVIYESTVYPGATEEDCVPILEATSGLKFNQDFTVGYSPERINPGDRINTVENILKITSGSCPKTAEKVDLIYRSVIKAGTYKAPSIKVAEAAKAIENAQRDVNIAFMNELAKIFATLEIDTQEVLKAAETKWNFLPFKPGLVGGHCTGVDPYYLAHKAIQKGYQPEIILASRKINDGMGKYVASETVKFLVKNEIPVKNAEILILGFAFKENCTDFRNTKVADIVQELIEFGTSVKVFDPWVNTENVQQEYHINLESSLPKSKFSAIILAVPHQEFLEAPFEEFLSEKGFIFDVKGVLPKKENTIRL